MTLKHLAFDLEIRQELPEGTSDWKQYAPLGISCAAITEDEVEHFWNKDRLTREEAQDLVTRLQARAAHDCQIVTWNGCSFDFHVLAEESGMYRECAELAINHCDLMLIVTAQKGHYLGLDRALAGARLGSKKHTVVLSDGTTIDDMGGAAAPRYWAAGEYAAVLEYLTGDVLRTQSLAAHLLKVGTLNWTTGSGKPASVLVPRRNGRMPTVNELFMLPEPDTSWMTNPPTRRQFLSWMPEDVVARYPHLHDIYTGET